ncbi:hypothetical protein [Sagittula salina]|uniref:Uncharacterized protein n=1 Tax=Sagittula salina TaxID=2820268 RepID=A0A940MTN2_9RHOB|nr:hypothetical protein [Sagittula salina]MBP0484666.1 hypothetical protein [Sagittula salina]
MAYSDEDLALLTDEEREALMEDDDSDGEQQGDDEPGGGDETAPAADGEDTIPADDDPAPAAAAAAEPEPQPQAAAPQPEPQREPMPDLADLDRQLADFGTQQKDTISAYADGDLSDEEYEQKLNDIQTARDAIVAQRAQVASAHEQEVTAWRTSVETHLAQYPELANTPENMGNLRAFDAQVRAVSANPAFAGKPDAEILRIAHKAVAATAADMGLSSFPALKGAAPAPKPKAEVPKGADGLGDPIQTLARVPVSDASRTGDNPFQALDELAATDTEAYEAHLATLPEADRERYLKYNY